MISASKVKYLQSLRLGKFRQKYNKFVAEGDKCCSEFLVHKRYSIDAIYATTHWEDRHPDLYDEYKSQVVLIDGKAMKKITHLKTSTDVMVVMDQRKDTINETLVNKKSILYLDGLQNPGNMGTIIRTADWYGIDSIVCSSDCVDYYHPKVVQAAMGSHNRMTCVTIDLQAIKEQSKLPILGTSLEGGPIQKGGIDMPCVLVIGNEGKGIRDEYISLIDHKVLIEGDQGRIAESLNAGIACAVMLDRLFG